MIKATVKITAILVNPDGVIETILPVEYPDETYAKQAVLQVVAGIRQIGLLRELSHTHVQWLSAQSPRVKDIEFELQTVSLADNLDMSAAVRAASRQGIIQP